MLSAGQWSFCGLMFGENFSCLLKESFTRWVVYRALDTESRKAISKRITPPTHTHNEASTTCSPQPCFPSTTEPVLQGHSFTLPGRQTLLETTPRETHLSVLTPGMPNRQNRIDPLTHCLSASHIQPFSQLQNSYWKSAFFRFFHYSQESLRFAFKFSLLFKQNTWDRSSTQYIWKIYLKITFNFLLYFSEFTCMYAHMHAHPR